jgi:P-type Ca2+ transporter type 2C
VFTRQTLDNPSAFVATAAVVVLLAFVVEMDILHGVFTTTELTSGQWLVCVAVGSVTLWVGELVKWGLRLRARRRSPSR